MDNACHADLLSAYTMANMEVYKKVDFMCRRAVVVWRAAILESGDGFMAGSWDKIKQGSASRTYRKNQKEESGDKIYLRKYKSNINKMDDRGECKGEAVREETIKENKTKRKNRAKNWDKVRVE